MPNSGSGPIEIRLADLQRQVDAAIKANEYSLIHNVVLEIALAMLVKGKPLVGTDLIAQARKHFVPTTEARSTLIRSAVEGLCERLKQ